MNGSRLRDGAQGAENMRFRRTILAVAGVTATAGTILVLSAAGANAAPKPPPQKVTLCHATASQKNPYRSITVNVAGGWDGHDKHTGPVFTPGIKGWGDIIPPTVYKGVSFSMNWDAAGQAIWNNGCVVPNTGPSDTESSSQSSSESSSESQSQSQSSSESSSESQSQSESNSSSVSDTAVTSSSSSAQAVTSSSEAAAAGGAAGGPIPAGANAGLHMPTTREGLAIGGGFLIAVGALLAFLAGVRPRRARAH
jgi:hypothetical protein